MNKVRMKTVLKQSTIQILVLILMTFAGLAGISWVMEHGNISSLFHWGAN